MFEVTKSSCIKCGHKRFEFELAEPERSRVKVYFVQCASCGGVVGVVPFHDTNTLLARMADKLGIHDLLR